MGAILEKISSYNLFNYLFPGAIFAVLADRAGALDLPEGDIATLLLIYYFIGLAVSRVGSVVLEPLLRASRLVRYSDYSDYIRAYAKDTKLEVLLEVGNTYRTLAAAFLLLPLAWAGRWAADALELDAAHRYIVLAVLLLVLFLFSFGKQSSYIAKRVDHYKKA